MKIAPASFAFLLLTACQGDETVSGYTQGHTVFALQSIDGAAFTARATLDLSQEGRISGQAPCNSYFADQTAPYPWFSTGPIGATRMACPDLDAETQFFAALKTMQIAEISGAVLILSTDDGHEMVFQAP